MYTWSPDGMRLAFLSARDGFDGLYTADADGQQVLRLTATPSINPEWRLRR
jgi:Tol biopolymer transport system component